MNSFISEYSGPSTQEQPQKDLLGQGSVTSWHSESDSTLKDKDLKMF